MRRLLIFCLALLTALPSGGADALGKFVSQVKTSCVSFDYTYKASGSVPLTGGGSAKVQGPAFVLKGDGLEVWCDGSVRWSLDAGSKEALVETLADERDFAGNPALLVSCVEEAFTRQAPVSSKFQDTACQAYSLSPVAASPVSRVTLFFDFKDTLLGASIKASDGTVTEFTIKSLAFSPQLPDSSFRFDISTLSSDWVITDLR